MISHRKTGIPALFALVLATPAFAQQPCFIHYMDGTKSKPMSKATAMLLAALPSSRKIKEIKCGGDNAQDPSGPAKPSNDTLGGEKPGSQGASAQTSSPQPVTETNGQPAQEVGGRSTQTPSGKDVGAGEKTGNDGGSAQATPTEVSRKAPEEHPIELNRETALSALTNSKWFPRDEVLGIYMGTGVNLRGILNTVANRAPNLANRLSRSYECTQKLGLITIEPAQNPAPRALGHVDISPTAKGLTVGKVVKGHYGFSSQLYVFKVGDEQAKAITGIKRSSDVGAEVEFDHVVTRRTELGDCLFSNETPSSVFRGTATFGRFDDGWRPEKVRVGGVNKDWVDLPTAEQAYNLKAP